METIETAPIYLDANGVAWIDKTNVKVIEVILDHLAYGWDPAEMHFQHPYLLLAQIHAAFAYYQEHQDELNAEIDRRRREVEAMMATADDSPIRRRLREAGKLR